MSLRILVALGAASCHYNSVAHCRSQSSEKCLAEHKVTKGPRQTMVEWELICGVEDETCWKVEHGLRLMSIFMDNVILFKEPLLIKVNYEYICNFIFFHREVASCTPSHLIQANENNLTLLYPQALHKQKHGKEPSHQTYDMTISFDAHFNFYFPMDHHSTQSSCRFDFMETLTHEVLHGLGVYSSLQKLASDLVAPIQATNKHFTGKETVYKEYLIFSLFDIHIIVDIKNTSLAYFAEHLRDLGPITLKPHESLKSRIFSFPHHVLLKKLAKSSKDSLSFQTLKGDKIKLNPSSFFSFNTPDHLDSSMYAYTRDEAMIPHTLPGIGLHDLFNCEKNWITSPFGPDTLEVLATLGYIINPSPMYEDSLEFYYAKQNKLPRDLTSSLFFRASPLKYFCFDILF
ncbi:hypothetical protein DSO57_1038442 [Entomophthora muscae]|uniref:Uncharacterized protein n=1 Tax=Entomophthora muscae TaxID=34485 RepID=A0ACC2T9L3_9FUNG|nr:hypothetical protein DSO57_1038442 [Entomophthora muscae]